MSSRILETVPLVSTIKGECVGLTFDHYEFNTEKDEVLRHHRAL
jgi:hypothetical protein